MGPTRAGRSFDRRQLLQGAAGAASVLSVGSGGRAHAADRTVSVGFLAPLTGPVAAWGKPGLDGCRLWADRLNAKGGFKVGDDYYAIEIVAHDDEYKPDVAAEGAKKLIAAGVKLVMMLGGDPWAGVKAIAAETGMLVSTLLPSDLSPDSRTLIAPCEVHPVYNVTGVAWLAENEPASKRVALCAQNDSLGKPSVATYLAAFEAAGMALVTEPAFFPATTTEFGPIVERLLTGKPDILCLDTCYTEFVLPLCVQAHERGFTGRVLSCTADYYDKIAAATSRDFMEGFVFQFPDFDDPALNDSRVNFEDPNGFYEQYVRRFGAGNWSAVSWEYASILDLWTSAATAAGSVEPDAVLTAMKAGGRGRHAFGDALWWGRELFGIDNALVGNWPVVVIENSKAVIKEFGSIPDWWQAHGPLLAKHMKAQGQMWDQRV